MTGNSLSYVRYLTTSGPLKRTIRGTISAVYRAGLTPKFMWCNRRRLRDSTLHPDDHRPRRPGAGPDVRLRHHGLRGRAVGAALDHHRHQPRGPGPGPRPRHGRPLSLLPAGRQPGGAAQGGRNPPPRNHRGPHLRQPAAGVRLRAGASHHPARHRQQRRNRRHLRRLPGNAGAAAGCPERRAGPNLAGMGDSPRRGGRLAGGSRRTCTANGGRPASPGSGR